MKIYEQTNDNDCGIAVTQSLIKHFHNIDVEKEELYDHANIGEDGMSIMDLENLNSKYGILLESYEMNFKDFKEYTTKEYFILIINKKNQHHFTIAKKDKTYVTLYDPADGRIKILYDQLEDIYENIFITISPKKITNILPKRIKENKKIYDIEKIWNLFLLNITTFAFSMVISFLTKYGIQSISERFDFLNVKTIFLSIVFMQIVFHFGEYLEESMMIHHKNQYSKNLLQFFLDSLKNKRNCYFKKLGKDQFLLIKNHIDNISTYHSRYINRWLISIAVLIFTGLFLLQVNPIFIPIMGVFGLIQWFFWNISVRFQNKNLPELMDLQNLDRNIILKLRDLVRDEVNIEHLKCLVQKYGNNHSKEILQIQKILENQNITSKINSFLNSVIYLVVMWMSFYLIFSNGLNYEYLSIINFFYNQISKSISSLGGYYSFKTQYEYSKKIYRQLTNVETICEDRTPMDPPKTISIENLCFNTSTKIIFNGLNLKINPNTIIYGSSGIGKSTLYKLISQKIEFSEGCIYFDETPMSSINPNSLNDLLVYQVDDGYIHNVNLLDLINLLNREQRNISMEICQRMKIKPINNMQVDSLSSGQRQLVRILELQKYSNKLLILDEIASHINLENKIFIFQKIMPYISSKNFLICSEHTPELIDLFSHSINLEDYALDKQ